ncbi:MAG: hypothetical protein H7067_08330, partial [Burkholderiales bacterium]|nr:hypothetical protein [Opitutaceae bacterium]
MTPRPLPCSPRFLALALLLLAAPLRTTAGPLQNPDFETPLNSFPVWSARDTVPVGAVNPPATTITRLPGSRPAPPGSPAVTGSWILDVATRDHVQDGPAQGGTAPNSLVTALLANGNGRAYTTRVWVKLDASAVEASVRCLLRWQDNGVLQTPLILAEAVITQPGVWIEVTGTTTLAWTQSLTLARVDFEVEQLHRGASPTPPPTWFPTYQLDDLQLELDDDADGLWNTEESADPAQTTLPLANNPDSDGDRMSDDWENAHAFASSLPSAPRLLNPRDPADAALDPDADGFSNVEEYFAATDPHSAASYPGKPSDPLATHSARALLRYLALRPSRQQALVGQMVSDNSTEYTAYVACLAAQPGWGRWPAILGLAVEKQNAPLDISASVDHAIPYSLAGGIVQIKWAMWNPWRAHLATPNQQIGFPGDQNQIDIPGLLDPAGITTTNNTVAENLAARAVLLSWIDTVATHLIRHRDATDGAPVLFRPISEMNGSWFWWGHRTRADYIGLWNLIRDRLVTHHGLHHLIWVYESASSEHQHPSPQGAASASDYYYPGDDRVDVMTHNLYDDDWALGWDANKIYARYPKIYGVPQAGPGKSLPTSRDGSFDNRRYIDQIAARYPRMSFFIAWNSFYTGGGGTHNHLAILDNAYAEELLADPRVITRDELRWLPPRQPAALATSSDTLVATWQAPAPPSPAPSAFLLEIAPSSTGPWSSVTTTAPAATTALAPGLP